MLFPDLSLPAVFLIINKVSLSAYTQSTFQVSNVQN